MSDQRIINSRQKGSATSQLVVKYIRVHMHIIISIIIYLPTHMQHLLSSEVIRPKEVGHLLPCRGSALWSIIFNIFFQAPLLPGTHRDSRTILAMSPSIGQDPQGPPFLFLLLEVLSNPSAL